MYYFEGVPVFDPDWDEYKKQLESRALKAVEQTELMPHPEDFDSEEEWDEAVEQYNFEEGMILDVDRED